METQERNMGNLTIRTGSNTDYGRNDLSVQGNASQLLQY